MAVLGIIVMIVLLAWIKWTVTRWHVLGWRESRIRYWDRLAEDTGYNQPPGRPAGERCHDNTGAVAKPVEPRLSLPVPDWMVTAGIRDPAERGSTGRMG